MQLFPFSLLLILSIILEHESKLVFGGFSPSRGVLGTGPSDDPISINPPNLPGGSVAVDAPPGPFFQDFRPPFPTDAWWSGFTVGNQDAVVAGPFPFQSQTTNTGLAFGISTTREFDGTSIHVRTSLDWSAGFNGLANTINNRKATSWDTQTVCLMYFNGVALATMSSCLVPGSPYMTLQYTNAVVVLSSLKGEILDFHWVTQGVKGIVSNVDGGTYIIYAIDNPIDLSIVGQTLTSTSTHTGTIRLAKLTNPNQEAILDTHAPSVPIGLTMSYNVANDVSTTTWTWNVVGNPDNLLILSWPHHRKVLQAPVPVAIEYSTLKGAMKGTLGNVWTLRHELPTISWFPSNPIHASCVSELTRTLEAEVQALSVLIPGDFYFWGGSFARVAQLATIAEQLGRTDLVDAVVAVLKESVEYWFDPSHRPAAAYETGWGGFVNGDGWNNTWVDFGNAYYNDHHFHYGYLLHGAAVIGKYDPAWLNQHLDFFMQCARNVGNPSPADPHYTVTRHMDWFAGHSWASGIANGAGPRDQESSGEAINGYYGLLLFAHAINHPALIDYSRLLLAYEIAGAQSYWHLYRNRVSDDEPYPEQGFRNLVTVGNVMDTQAGAWLFWGDQKTQIAAIQILPLTPIGVYTYDEEWIQEVIPYCQDELEDPSIGDAFKSVIYAAYAKVNPSAAFTYSMELFDWGTGNSASNQLYFVATQQSDTDICRAGDETPEGIFVIQDVESGRFVALSGAEGQLSATAFVDVLATRFRLAFRPGGSTIQALSNGLYVTAPADGAVPLSASRDVPQAFETFRWSPESDGTFTLKAMVNRAFVNTAPGSGQMINNGVASKYRLVPADVTNPEPLPVDGVLRNIQTNNYVIHTGENPILYASTGSVDGATRFAFERIPQSPDNAPLYALKSLSNSMYVTTDLSGATPLSAASPTPQAWEYFQFISYQGNYIMIHFATGLAVGVQPDNTLIDNNSNIDSSAQWIIE